MRKRILSETILVTTIVVRIMGLLERILSEIILVRIMGLLKKLHVEKDYVRYNFGDNDLGEDNGFNV